MKSLMNSAQVSKYLKIDITTLQNSRWRKDAAIPYYKIGDTVRYKLSDVNKFLLSVRNSNGFEGDCAEYFSTERHIHLMTAGEAAEYLSVHKATISLWRNGEKKGLPFYKIGRVIRYDMQDLEEFKLTRWVKRRKMK